MKITIALLNLLIMVFALNTYAEDPNETNNFNNIQEIKQEINTDSLIIGKNYIFGTKQKIQYSGKYLGQDSVYYKIKTDEKTIKIKKENVILYKEQNSDDAFVSSYKDTLYNIELKDGNDITGYIISRDSLNISVKTKSGVVMTIPRKEIVNITAPKIEYVDGEYYIKDPNDARLFLAPTARPIRKNSGFLSDVELLFPMAGFGIENYVSFVGGISIIPFSESQLVYINAKVTPIRSKYMDLAVGYFYINATSSSTKGLSVGYAGGTFGSKRASITLGCGVTFQKEISQTPMFILGGEVRASNNIKFIMENWIFTYKEAPILSFGGVRFFGSKIAADFALMRVWYLSSTTSSTKGWPFFPYLSFTYNLDLN